MLERRLPRFLMMRLSVAALVLTFAGCGAESALYPYDGSTTGTGGGAGGHAADGGGAGGSDGGLSGTGGAAGNRDGGTDGATDGAGVGGTTGAGGTAGVTGAGGRLDDGGTGTGGATGVGGVAGAGTGGTSSLDAGADAVTDAPVDQSTLAAKGAPCNIGADCASNNCADKVCCDLPCMGLCSTCAAPANPGTCVPADPGTDPRNDCEPQDVSTCGTDGFCNGAGACRLYAAGKGCSSSPCNSSGSAVILSAACNGSGTCAVTTQDCDGFLCSTTSGTCRTTCAADTDCAATSFCSSSGCVQKPANIAGNGDLEYGSTDGWSVFSGGFLDLNNTAAAGIVHAGQYSLGVLSRGQLYQGPAYAMPTGPGKYVITGWGMQKDVATLAGALQIAIMCGSSTNYFTVGAFGVTMSQGVWTKFTGTVDTSMAPATPDCLPGATPAGLVKLATLYLNQTSTVAPDAGAAFPELYIDDLAIQVTDGHNLVGNPNFEAGLTSGWGVNGAGSLTTSASFANTGTQSLRLTARTTSATGPTYVLPTGAAKYSVTFHALQNGTMAHDLTIQSSYTCLGGAQTLGPVVATAPGVATGAWTTLSGAVTLPPAGAPAGCRMTQATLTLQQEAGVCGTGTGQIECPDLYVDDVSITLAP